MEEKYKELLDELEGKYNDLELDPDEYELLGFVQDVIKILIKYDELKQATKLGYKEVNEYDVIA